MLVSYRGCSPKKKQQKKTKKKTKKTKPIYQFWCSDCFFLVFFWFFLGWYSNPKVKYRKNQKIPKNPKKKLKKQKKPKGPKKPVSNFECWPRLLPKKTKNPKKKQKKNPKKTKKNQCQFENFEKPKNQCQFTDFLVWGLVFLGEHPLLYIDLQMEILLNLMKNNPWLCLNSQKISELLPLKTSTTICSEARTTVWMPRILRTQCFHLANILGSFIKGLWIWELRAELVVLWVSKSSPQAKNFYYLCS